MFKIKISQADKFFSLYIRDRAGWKCERCLTQYSHPTSGLQCSHFYGRGNKSVRFDEDNAAALCFKCHQYFTANPADHRDWFFKRLGEKKYDLLTIRRNKMGKADEKLIILWLKPYLKEKGLLGKTTRALS